MPAPRAGAEQLGVRAGRRADEHEVDGASAGRSSIAGDRVDAEDRPALAVRGVHRARVALAEDVVQRDEAELAGVARRARDDDAARLEQRAEVLGVDAASVGHRRDLHERVDRDRRPSTTISGFTSTLRRRRVGPRRARRGPAITATSASRSTAGSPRNAPSSAWVAGRRSSPRRRPALIGTRRNATSAIASARIAADAEHHASARTAGRCAARR